MATLQQALHDNTFKLSLSEIEQLDTYLALLNKWNAAYNLTSITDYDEQIYKHILDSLSIHSFLQGESMLDVGTGAGLPGIPLAIINPEKQFILLDSNQKKTRFLVQAVAELGLDNVQVAHQRLGDSRSPVGSNEIPASEGMTSSKKFQTITSRAFSSLEDFLRLTQDLIQPDGQWLAMKGAYPEEEIAKVAQDFIIEDVRQLHISGLNAQRHLVIIKKG